jgi:hypothetical protein
MRLDIFIALILALAAAHPIRASAEQRAALVPGNSNYHEVAENAADKQTAAGLSLVTSPKVAVVTPTTAPEALASEQQAGAKKSAPKATGGGHEPHIKIAVAANTQHPVVKIIYGPARSCGPKGCICSKRVSRFKKSNDA